MLIAQNESCGRFYAIENAHRGIYAICRLAQWVPEDALKAFSATRSACNPPFSKKRRDEQEIRASEWWHSAVAPSHTVSPDLNNDSDAIARARRFKLSLNRPLRRDLSPILNRVTTSATSPKEKPLSRGAESRGEITDDSTLKPADSLKAIKSHYQDALYLSKASLAYFAKGPLSRARACFQCHDGSAKDSSNLTQYLRTMILDLHVMDKKYRETLPELVKDFPFTLLSDGESASVIETVQKKSRKSKKDRVNRNGLYAGEDVTVARWWLSRDISGISCDSSDAQKESKERAIHEQRAREAQLQIILLLETLALEANAVLAREESAQMGNFDQEQEGGTTKAKKSKKPRILRTLLDLLADRLCIWQSMSVEVEKPSANEKMQPSSLEKRFEDLGDDHLRQFCIDVIIPL